MARKAHKLIAPMHSTDPIPLIIRSASFFPIFTFASFIIVIISFPRTGSLSRIARIPSDGLVNAL
jgi:hypothetical protein